MAVVGALPGYRIKGLSFRAFVYGIAAHKVTDAFRAIGRNRSEPRRRARQYRTTSGRTMVSTRPTAALSPVSARATRSSRSSVVSLIAVPWHVPSDRVTGHGEWCSAPVLTLIILAVDPRRAVRASRSGTSRSRSGCSPCRPRARAGTRGRDRRGRSHSTTTPPSRPGGGCRSGPSGARRWARWPLRRPCRRRFRPRRRPWSCRWSSPWWWSCPTSG